MQKLSDLELLDIRENHPLPGVRSMAAELYNQRVSNAQLTVEVEELRTELETAEMSLRQIATIEIHGEGSLPVTPGELREIARKYFTPLSAHIQDKTIAMKWQPIETAPKDGTEILVYCPKTKGTSQLIFVAWWESATCFGKPFCNWSYGYYEEWNNDPFVPIYPTHWMPLPALPKSEVEDGCIENTLEWSVSKELLAPLRSNRTNSSYFDHVKQGVHILKLLNCPVRVQQAFAIHPLFQDDNKVGKNLSNYAFSFDPYALALAMEYRWVANNSTRPKLRNNGWQVTLSIVPEVNNMLIADKIQNRKAFEEKLSEASISKEEYNEISHYFRVWLDALGITESQYQNIVSQLS